jgi:uncharacterized Zn finger protein
MNCPQCSGELVSVNDYESCTQCGHVPPHGAD